MAKRGSKKKEQDGVDKQMVQLDPIPVGDDGELMLRPLDVKDILDIIEAEGNAQAFKDSVKNLKEKMAERTGAEMSFINKLVRNAKRVQKDEDALKEDIILISATEQFKVMESGVESTRKVEKMNAELAAKKAEEVAAAHKAAAAAAGTE